MAAKKQYALRTCNADMTSYNGFKWPSKLGSKVTAPDWNEEAVCGNGLHGLLDGHGDAGLLDWSPDAKWLVVEIIGKTVNLSGKIKFKICIVRCVGDRKQATDYIISKGADPSKCVGSFLTGGYGSTLTGDDRSTLTGDDGSTLTGGYWSTLTGGYGSTLTGGDGSTLSWRIWDGNYYRIHTFYVGENGVKANTKYKLEKGKIVEIGG